MSKGQFNMDDAIRAMIKAGHPRMPWESVRVLCDWPRGKFSMRDEPDEHGHTWLILPDGQMVDISHHNNPAVNPAQVAWMVEVLNRALAAEDEASNSTSQQRDAAPTVMGPQP